MLITGGTKPVTETMQTVRVTTATSSWEAIAKIVATNLLQLFCCCETGLGRLIRPTVFCCRMNGDRLDRQDINIELLIKERDEYQREAAASNAELFSVLKKQEYRSADELALVRFN